MTPPFFSLGLSFERWWRALVVDVVFWGLVSAIGLLVLGPLLNWLPQVLVLMLAGQLWPSLVGSAWEGFKPSPGKYWAGLEFEPRPFSSRFLRYLAKTGAFLGTAVLFFGVAGLLYQNILSPLWTWFISVVLWFFLLLGAWLSVQRACIQGIGMSLFDQLTGSVQKMKGDMFKGASDISVGLIIGGILAGLFFLLPNQGGPCHLCRNEEVLANMLRLQTMVETYALDWEGQYPSGIPALAYEGTHELNTYWRELHNPFPLQSQIGPWVFKRGSGGRTRAFSSGKSLPGAIVYAPVWQHNTITAYAIYGFARDGSLLRYQGRDFILRPE